MSDLSAMILTGGSSKRFGSDKSQALLGAKTLIENLLTTLPPDIDVIIVGPEIESTSREVKFTQEIPAGAGPVAAIQAGLNLITSMYVFLVATDMPFAAKVLNELSANTPVVEDVTMPMDANGILQPLCALYRSEALSRAIIEMGSTLNQSVRNLIQNLEIRKLQLSPTLQRILIDVDTPLDLQRAISLGKNLNE